MYSRSTLHRLVDALPDEDLSTAGRVLVGLTATGNAVDRALSTAADDDEADRDDEDGGLTEARRELASGEGISSEELRRELGLA